MKKSILSIFLLATVVFNITTAEARQACKDKEVKTKSCRISKTQLKNRRIGGCNKKSSCGAKNVRQHKFAKLSCTPCGN